MNYNDHDQQKDKFKFNNVISKCKYTVFTMYTCYIHVCVVKMMITF